MNHSLWANIVDAILAILLAAIAIMWLWLLASDLNGQTIGINGHARIETLTKPLPVDVEGPVALHVLIANDEGETVAEVVTKPLFAFRVEAGKVSPSIIDCIQSTEHRKVSEVDYPVVVLTCGETKLALVGIDMTVHK